MNTYQFKTNINCGGCIKTVTPFMEQLEGIASWEVDTNDKNKILSVKTEQVSPEAIVEKVKAAGFNIEQQKAGIWSKLF